MFCIFNFCAFLEQQKMIFYEPTRAWYNNAKSLSKVTEPKSMNYICFLFLGIVIFCAFQLLRTATNLDYLFSDSLESDIIIQNPFFTYTPKKSKNIKIQSEWAASVYDVTINQNIG